MSTHACPCSWLDVYICKYDQSEARHKAQRCVCSVLNGTDHRCVDPDLSMPLRVSQEACVHLCMSPTTRHLRAVQPSPCPHNEAKDQRHVRACVRMVKFAPRRSPMSFLGGGSKWLGGIRGFLGWEGGCCMAQAMSFRRNPTAMAMPAPASKPRNSRPATQPPRRLGMLCNVLQRRPAGPRGHLSAMMMPANR